MENETILNSVMNYAYKNPVRFHMPGHKGKNIEQFDVTELKDTDNLYDPQKDGIVYQSFEYAKSIYKTANTIFSAGGATLALQAAIATVVKRGKRIICDRKCHKSVVNAMILCGVEPIWVYDFDNLPAADGMIITSPNYYGEMFEMPKKHDMLLICDNSHGSHLAWWDSHPYQMGADIVIDSIHKTLPALTGAALLHANEKFTTEELLSSLRLFASTSPSYLISSSICVCLQYMEANGRKQLEELHQKIINLKIILREFGYGVASFKIEDPFRVCIHINNAEKFYNYLYENNIVCEFYDVDNVILIPSIMNTDEDFYKLIDCCIRYKPEKCEKADYNFELPLVAMNLREASFSSNTTVAIDNALNCICGEIYAPYPPGIPVIMPGEIFNEEIINFLKASKYEYVKIVKEKEKNKL
ncbi:MAG: hypothetical protein FWF15_08925 [Oscillospiraceae bacterium]|nr:hypothetical protein [Oscillospiraceae bacterium]